MCSVTLYDSLLHDVTLSKKAHHASGVTLTMVNSEGHLKGANGECRRHSSWRPTTGIILVLQSAFHVSLYH
jgi:hypothetical protein